VSTLKLLTGAAVTYTFDPQPKVEIMRERLARGDGDRQGCRTRWTITGRLHGTEAQLKTKRDALETAFTFDDDTTKSLKKYGDDGVTVLDELSDSTYKGLRAERPIGYPVGAGVQWATIRDYTILCRATTIDSDVTARDAWGEYSTTEQIGEDGQNHVVITGEFIGQQAQLAADDVKLSSDVMVLGERQTTNTDQQKVEFEYRYVRTGTGESREVISFVESVEVTHGGSTFVDIPVLGGGNPERFTTPVVSWRATQSGSAVGRTGYPSFPAKLYSTANLLPDSTDGKRSPKLTQDDQLTEYEIHWNWIYQFNTAGSLLSPNTPPTTMTS